MGQVSVFNTSVSLPFVLITRRINYGVKEKKEFPSVISDLLDIMNDWLRIKFMSNFSHRGSQISFSQEVFFAQNKKIAPMNYVMWHFSAEFIFETP